MDLISNADSMKDYDERNKSIVSTINIEATADSNEKMLKLFSLCEEYLQRQNQIENFLRDGYFHIALTKKNQCGSIISLSDCRFEIDPTLTVETSKITKPSCEIRRDPDAIDEASDPKEPNYKISVEDDHAIDQTDENSLEFLKMNIDKSNDSAYLFSGLPSKQVRKAQSDFTNVTKCLIAQANLKNELMMLLNEQTN